MPKQVLAEQVPLEILVTEFGPLASTVPLLDLETIQHADELTKARRLEEDETKRNKLREVRLYTADSAVYTVENEETILYLGRGRTNPVFKNLEEATRQLLETGNYIPSKEDIETVKSANSTLRVKLSDLRLQGDGNEWRYLEIDTSNPDSLNHAERAFAERVYGQGDDFKQNMKMFNENRIRKIRVYVLNPDYVKKNAPKDGGLVRVCRLDVFGNVSRFNAIDRYIGSHNGLRGVRNVTEGDAPKMQTK